MTWTRGLGVLALAGVALAQEAMPFRFTADLDTVTRYGGKSETLTAPSFVFATGPDGSSRVPEGLKAAFERDAAGPLGQVGPITTYSNSTETVLEAREDGSRVVQVESISQSTAPLRLGIAQRSTSTMMRLHFPDGSLALEDVTVKVEGSYLPNADEERDAEIRQAVALGLETGLRVQTQVFEGCYQALPGPSVPLMLDPKALQPTVVGESATPLSLERTRAGDLRVTRLPDGGVECRVSFEPQRYGIGQGPVKIVQRQTLRFSGDGRLERSEFVSSTTFKDLQTANYEFDGQLYRVRSVYSSRVQGASDRLP